MPGELWDGAGDDGERRFLRGRHAREGGRIHREEMKWLPNMDLNHDKLLQRQLCYRYTIRQMGRLIYGAQAHSQVS